MPPGPVDGGLICWLQVAGSFGLWANTWGIVNSYGVFQTYYEVTDLSGKSPSQISWIGSLQGFLLVFVGVLSGPLFDAGYSRVLNLVGNFMVVFGFMMTSLCHEYWQAILAQGVLIGIGCGLLFIPTTGILPQYWVKKRAFASCVAGAGAGVGGLIFPIVFRELQPKVGFGWAVRVIGFIALFFGIASNVLLKNKLPAGQSRKLIDLDFFNNVPLAVFWFGLFWGFMGLWIPRNYIGTYALESRIAGETIAFYLVAILQAGAIVGRIGPGLFADKIGPLNMLIPSTLVSSVLVFCWIAIKNEAGLIVFAVLYGAMYGVILGMAPPAAITLMKGDLKRYGSFVGMGSFTASPGVLIGNPIAGAILRGSGGFVGLQAFTGSILLLAGLLFIAARIMAVGFGRKAM
ncbi:hypothetical protein M409DRAFT_68885 [Zasmidium cellare ATCC 36951]|uniref:Major facilitator superfamily (MFS) profile domain-containing protein n=1 Tax=Zasmidium cellare ATCC 36951 TaxID=1080233 RepID=A0A6A6CBA9_ZASCE|nr:uncharacterized protein M409DRAFT_68885 [Zasmidium cellare ATCC 36951]KAF2162939.1 hypothetical protein M409DRAFT_68885 [Zasmidium cellare ATCC 36951]